MMFMSLAGAGTLRRKIRRLCRSTGAAAIVALLVPAFAQAVVEKGVVTDLTWGSTTDDQDRTGQKIVESGAQWALMVVKWAEVEPTTKGSYDQASLDRLDRAVTVARSAGAKVIVTVYTSPPWASGAPEWDRPPADPADYGDFIGFLAARYQGQVAAWEIWNEENLSRFWMPTPSAGDYARLLKAAYPAAKQADPSARVLFGGMQYNDYRFLEAAYAAEPDVGDYFDAVATHAYVFGGGPPEEVAYEPDGRMARESFGAYQEVRASLLAQGDDKPIFLTELGWSTSVSNPWGVTLEEQADYLTRAYRQVAAHPYVEAALWYQLRNNFWNNDGDSWDDQLGLLRTDFSPKPAWAAFVAVDGTVGPTPSGGESPGPAAPPAAGPGNPPGPVARQATATSLTVRRLVVRAARIGSRLRRPTTSLNLSGSVRNARRGVARILVQRREGRRWRTVAVRRRAVGADGRFRPVNLVGVRPARWRARATYLGSYDRQASTSPWRELLVRRRT
jgi:hypothetical protein